MILTEKEQGWKKKQKRGKCHLKKKQPSVVASGTIHRGLKNLGYIRSELLGLSDVW